MSNLIIDQHVNEHISLRAFKSDIGCHFEVMKDRKLVIGTYFLYGEKIHKVTYCLGGSVYGFFNDDKLSEDIMSIIETNKEVLGGYELSR